MGDDVDRWERNRYDTHDEQGEGTQGHGEKEGEESEGAHGTHGIHGNIPLCFARHQTAMITGQPFRSFCSVGSVGASGQNRFVTSIVN